MKIIIFGDANVDVTVSRADVKHNISRLSPVNRKLVSDGLLESRSRKTDLEFYLKSQDKELSKFFNSLNPRIAFGGCGAIKAKTLASLGHKVVFYSWVGDDGNGMMILDELSDAGVDISNVLVAGSTCETYNIFEQGKSRLAFSYWRPKARLSDILKKIKDKKFDAVLLTGAHRVKKGLGYAKLSGAYVFTGSFAGYTKKELAAKYRADFSGGILVGNDTEIMQLSGTKDPLSGVGWLPNNVVVMHGPHLTAVKRGGEIVISRTAPLRRSAVKELTGVGDVWEAEFLGSVGDLLTSSHQKIRNSMLLASRAAVRKMTSG